MVVSIVSDRGRREPIVLVSEVFGSGVDLGVCTLSASTAEDEATDREGGARGAKFVPCIQVGVVIPEPIIPGVA